MTAVDYPVTFGYGAQDGEFYGPRGSVGRYHRGNDHACPVGTPIVIAGVTIGLTGNTGVTGGPHLHVQAGTDQACQKDIDPSPFEFQPGTVVAVGTGSQWGKYVTLQVAGRYVTYCHMSRQDVNVGQVIQGGEDMVDKGDLRNLTQDLLGRAPLDSEASYVGQPFSDVYYSLVHSHEYETAGRLAVVADRLERAQDQVKLLQKQLQEPDTSGDALEKLEQIKKILE